MKKGDLLIIAILLATAALLFLAFSPRDAGGVAYVVVIKDGRQVFREPLHGTDTHWADPHNRVVVRDGRVWMEWSDCANQVCVHAGEIGEAGQQIVCLPNRVMVRIEAANAALDGITY